MLWSGLTLPVLPRLDWAWQSLGLCLVWCHPELRRVPFSPTPQNPLSPQWCGIRTDDPSLRNTLFSGNGVASSQAMLHPQLSIPAHAGRAGQGRAARLLLVILTKPAKFNSNAAPEQRQCLSCVPACSLEEENGVWKSPDQEGQRLPAVRLSSYGLSL